MSSRFVSAGAINPTTGEVTAPASVPTSSISPPPASSEITASTSAVPSTSSLSSSEPTIPTPAPPSDPNPPAAPSKKSQEWLTVQAELEAAKQQRSSLKPSTIGGPPAEQQKSLYEVLQANKAAKQAAFEEANKIKNQFRALDDDEIEFLESVAERKRREEEERRKEEEGDLRKFREMQRKGSAGNKEGEGERDESEGEMGEEELMFLSGTGNGRKRRRGEERRKGLAPGVKRVKSNGEEGKENNEEVRKEEIKTVVTESVAATATTPAATVPAKKPLGGLVSYGSSDEDDD